MPAIHDLDDMPAKSGLHRGRDFSRLQGEGRVGEFRHHLVFGEIAQIAPLGAAGALRFFLGDRCEVATLLQLGDDGISFRLGLHENMTGAHFIRPFVHGLVGFITGLQCFLGGNRGNLV